MAIVALQKCFCGIELKILKALDDRKQMYTCDCQRELEIVGTVLNMQYTKADSASKERDWAKVPAWRLKNGV